MTAIVNQTTKWLRGCLLLASLGSLLFGGVVLVFGVFGGRAGWTIVGGVLFLPVGVLLLTIHGSSQVGS